MTKAFAPGQRIRLPDSAALVIIEVATATPDGWQLFVDDGSGTYRKILLTPALAEEVTVVAEDGAAEPAIVLAGLWAEWMRAATLESKATTLA